MTKIAISIRLEEETIAFFRKSHPEGYQKGISEVLRAHIRNSLRRRENVVGRAQEIYRNYHARCFWHLDPNLILTAGHIPMFLNRLRLHGGREGFLLAAELQSQWEGKHAAD